MPRYSIQPVKKCREKGIQFCYHNHAQEFELYDGEFGLDLLFKETDPGLVKAELDVYWVEYAGQDAVEYIKKYSGRCPLIHLKDMEAGESKFYAEVGNGILDIRNIILTSKSAGVEWYIVEQDECRGPALESVRKSYNNLKRMGLF